MDQDHSETSHDGESGFVRPLKGIWTQPESALAYAIDHRLELYVHRLFAGLGLAFVLATRLPDWMGTFWHPIGIMIQVLLVGPVGGIIGGYIYSAVFRNMAGFFGGTAENSVMRTAVAWTNVPVMLAYAVFLIAFLLMDVMRISEAEGVWLFQGFLGYVPALVAAPFMLYAVFIRIRGAAYALGLTRPKAALVWLLTTLATYLPLIGIGIVYYLLYSKSIDYATS